MKTVPFVMILLLTISCLKNGYQTASISNIKEKAYREFYPQSNFSIENTKKCEK